jgi:hypothetical protein
VQYKKGNLLSDPCLAGFLPVPLIIIEILKKGSEKLEVSLHLVLKKKIAFVKEDHLYCTLL